jgi:hypothetical protein
VTVDVAVVCAFEVSAKSKVFNPSKEIRVIRECILQRTVLLAGLAHEYAFAFFQYLRFDDSRVISEIRDIDFTSKDSVHRFAVAVGA